MLDIGWSELVVIGVVALVVVGPKELPALLRTVGQWVGKARRMASEFQGQINDAIREAELEDVKKSVDDLRSLSPTRLVSDHLASIGNEIESVGQAAKAELASIETATPADAGSALSAFTETSPVPAISADQAETMIQAAGTPVPDLTPPSFAPAPFEPGAVETPVAAAADPAPEVAASDAAPEKKADPA